MERQNCLVRRMLHASVEAYHPDERPRRGGEPGWTRQPRQIGSGIDLALVGRIQEGVLVAFRGTLPPVDLDANNHIDFSARDALASIPDWVNDARIALKRNPLMDGVTLPGAIHGGLAGSAIRLWGREGNGIAAEVNRLLGEGAPRRLYFTGHSKGGALANLVAYRARKTNAWRDAAVKVVTIGAPCVGDRDFAREYRSAGIDCVRYEAAGDIVPRAFVRGRVEGSFGFPFFGKRYEPVGTLRAPIPPPGTPPLPPNDDRRHVPPPIDAHLPYPGFLYGDGVCEDGCPHNRL